MNISKIKNIINIIMSIMIAIWIVAIPFMCGYLSASINSIPSVLIALYVVLIGVSIAEIGIISILLMIEK